MKNVSKVVVEVTFPNGGHFYTNLNLIVYKQFLQFIHHLSCLSPNEKCFQCSLSNECRYYQMTGNNFSDYPGIFLNVEMFPKSIYQKEENASFTFYFIGNMQRYQQYVHLFFQSYLEQQIAGTFFYLKSIQPSTIEETTLSFNVLQVKTMIEQENFISSYNAMIDYYNTFYDCHFKPIEDNLITIEKTIRKISDTPFSVKTKKIYRSGFIGNYHFNTTISMPSSLYEIGIGKLNYLGGGKLGGEPVEIKN